MSTAPPSLKKPPPAAAEAPAAATTKTVDKPSPTPARPRRRLRLPLKIVGPIIWVALWGGWVGWSALQATRAVAIPEDLEVSVKLPDVNQRALNEIRTRQAAGIIVPSQNNTPRSNPFQ